MNATSLPIPTGSLFNLAGPDLVIILLFLLFLGAAVIGIVLVVTYVNRRKSAEPPPAPTPASASPAERLQQLELLKQQKLVSEAEYSEQRRRIISAI